MNSIIHDIVALAIGYLLGSIPFGLLLTRLAGTTDLRAIGSGNIGATNVLRTGRKDLAAATLLLDGLKGTAAALIGALAFAGRWRDCRPCGVDRPCRAGLAAIQGRQGRCDVPWRALWAQLADGADFLRRLAVGGGAVAILVAWRADRERDGASGPVLLGHRGEAFAVALMAAIVFYRHRENIARLRAGTETRIGQKA